MKKLSWLLLLFPIIAQADFVLTSPAFENKAAMPYKYGLCKPTIHGYTSSSSDISPPMQWSGAPDATKSYALLMSDAKIPQKFALHNYTHTIPKNFPREKGYHWLLVNIPAKLHALPAKAGPNTVGPSHYGIQGMNYYSRVTGSDMGGYGGPCPPVNDSVTHQYVFMLYALNVANLNIPASGAFMGPDVLNAMHSHILAKAKLTAKYITKSYNRHLDS